MTTFIIKLSYKTKTSSGNVSSVQQGHQRTCGKNSDADQL